jgi:hypothetical protein
MSECIPAWQFFAALQSEADPQSIDRSSASDEALDVVLHEVLADPAPDGDLVRKRYYSLRRNRLSKLNNRRALDRLRCRGTHRRCGSDIGSLLLMAPARDVVDEIAYGQLTELIRTVLPDEDFMFLLDVADSEGYADVACDRNMTVSGVKSKAFRVREKVRNSSISATLRRGLRR